MPLLGTLGSFENRQAEREFLGVIITKFAAHDPAINVAGDVVAWIIPCCRRGSDWLRFAPVHHRKLTTVPFKHHAGQRHHIPPPPGIGSQTDRNMTWH